MSIARAAILEERARALRRREEVRRQQTINRRRPYQRRPDRQTLYIRSLSESDVLIRVSASEASLTSAGGAGALAPLGVLERPTANATIKTVRDEGVIVPRMQWYRGQTTPQRINTDWGTTYMRYYEDSGNQSHFSVPISKVSATDGIDDMLQAFRDYWTPERVRTILRPNGRVTLLLGRLSLASIDGE